MLNSKKLVFVTGAGRGIGRAISLYLCQAGFAVSACSRSFDELSETQKLSDGKMRVAQVDVKDFSAVESWIEEEQKIVSAAGGEIWGLITAAGVYGPIGPFVENDWETWKESIEANLYGTASAAKVFVKSLLERELPGRIICLSGGGATQPLPRFTSYCASKAAVVRFAETLAHELKEFSITVNSVAPGAVNTKLTDELILAGADKAGKEMFEKAIKQKESGGADPKASARLCEYLLSDEASNVTGRVISALWDDWLHLHEQGKEFEKSDIYTIRRIVPSDRKK